MISIPELAQQLERCAERPDTHLGIWDQLRDNECQIDYPQLFVIAVVASQSTPFRLAFMTTSQCEEMDVLLNAIRETYLLRMVNPASAKLVSKTILSLAKQQETQDVVF